MTAAVVFDYNGWIARYPEFAGLSQPLAQAYFDEGNLYCANDASNPAFAAGVLPTLLNMLAAHIAWLNAPRDASGNPASSGGPASPLVGRINSASEGSVSVGVEANYAAGTPQWFQQTRYGSAYWAASAQFRTMRYYATTPVRVPSAVFPFRV